MNSMFAFALAFAVAVASPEAEHFSLTRRLGRVDVKFVPAIVNGEKYRRPIGASKLIDDARSADSLTGATASTTSASYECGTEQVHITLGEDDSSIIISFVSFNSSLPSTVTYSTSEQAISSNYASSTYIATGSKLSYSQILYVSQYLYAPAMGAATVKNSFVANLQNTTSWAFNRKTGEHWASWNKVYKAVNGVGDYKNPYMYYDSPFIHTVSITGLSTGTRYYYQPAGSCKVYCFQLPEVSFGTAKSYPFHLGVTVDLGQTAVSNASINALIKMQPAAVLLAGDLSYADGWTPRWDSFGRLIEPLAAHIPLLTTGGNHEVGSGETWQSYAARYPTPHKQAGSSNFCYWGREIGVTHVIALCSYAGYNASSIQYRWLQQYLGTRLNRTKTPWVVVMMHAPMYSTNKGHWMEGELFRLSVEPLLHQYGVDIVIAGHVHAYERTHPVYNNEINPCGATYLLIGDGGNYEGAYVPWRNDKNGGNWTAFREGSFGVAELTFLSSSAANFSWHRHACGSDSSAALYMNFSDSCVTPGDNSTQRMLTSDSIIITRPPFSKCPNKWVSTATTAPATSPTSTPANSSSSESTEVHELKLIVAVLAFLVAVLGASCIGLVLYMMSSWRQQEKNNVRATEITGGTTDNALWAANSENAKTGLVDY